LGRNVQADLRYSAGWPVYHTAPSPNSEASHEISNFVLFLHGGGYINEIVKGHWRFVGHLTRDAQARCIVPIFPLAPQGTAADVVPAVGRLLRELIDSVGSAKVSVVGQSAGAGIALAAVQWLRDSGSPQPKVLASSRHGWMRRWAGRSRLLSLRVT
jgi:acetyl esterase/lipase